MKFQKDHVLIADGRIEKLEVESVANGIRDTLAQDGGSTWIFAQRALAAIEIDCSDCKYFEVGPRRGLHTILIDLHKPKSITCVEAPNKLRADDRYLRENRLWIPNIQTENLEVHYQDFDKFISEEKYDLLFYCGVLYHNINQVGQLKKLHSIAADGAYMIFESATTRNEDLMNKNVIEVHYPPYSPAARAQTCVFRPSKDACKSMLDIAGWEIVETSDGQDDVDNLNRISILCRKGFPRKNRHLSDKNLS